MRALYGIGLELARYKSRVFYYLIVRGVCCRPTIYVLAGRFRGLAGGTVRALVLPVCTYILRSMYVVCVFMCVYVCAIDSYAGFEENGRPLPPGSEGALPAPEQNQQD